MFAGLLADRGDHRAGRFVCEDDVVAFAGRLRFGKDIIFHGAAERAAHFQTIVVSLAAKDTRVDGFEEGAHRIVFGHEKKIDGAVRAGDVAVEADAEAEDDFANFALRTIRDVLFRRLLCCLLRHSYWLPFDRPAQPRVATLPGRATKAVSFGSGFP